MNFMHRAMVLAVCLGLAMTTVYTQQRGRGAAEPPRQWWVAKAKPGQYGTNKPHIKLPDLKARHKGQANWMEVVVNDENYHAEYNQGAPGTKIATVMHPDTREFYAVMEGQMRFTLEGQPEPITATRGSIIKFRRRRPIPPR
jgi:mannose-6-phosphate isomerase-like protein (cupin superfamily)